MPELPEVETTVRGLVAVIDGRRIADVDQRRPDLRFPFPPDLRQRLTGARVTRLGRRAKYGLIETDRDDTLIFHLGINMWDAAAPFVREWIRTELGPEAALADGLREQAKTLALVPDIIRRLDAQLPRPGGAPPEPPLPAIPLMWERRGRQGGLLPWLLTAAAGVAAGAGAMWLAIAA